MVQNKQKSNKINITALITCFMLIMVFVFGCVHFVYASESYYSIGFYHINSKGVKYWDGVQVKVVDSDSVICATRKEINGDQIFTVYSNKQLIYYPSSNDSMSLLGTYSGKKIYYVSFRYSLGSQTFGGYTSDMIIFASEQDCINFLVDGTKENVVYQKAVYDKDIPTPKNLEVYFDRKLNKPFNLADLCNPLKIKWSIPEDSDYSDYTLDVQIDVNYNKLNSISGIGTKPTVLQTGKVEFASCSATDKELNISATYDGWTKLSEKYQTSTWGLTGNYFDLWLRYKDSSGNYGNWVKVTINPDNSSTVVKSGFFDNGTNTTINKGYEEISGDSGEHVKGDYDNYYVNTLDDNISNNLTSLKNNYSNLVSFYKELFSFLPAEIWIILIGLVSTMVVIAIIKFVRG